MKKLKNNKHSRPPAGLELDKQVDKVFNNPRNLSRWIALLNGVKVVFDHSEKWKLDIDDKDPGGDGRGKALQKYIDEKAPRILDELNNLNRTVT